MGIEISSTARAEIAAILSLQTGAEFQTRVNAFLRSLLVENNNWNTAALRDTGLARGNVPEIGAGDALPPQVLPQWTETEIGGGRLGTPAEHSIASPPADVAATPAGFTAFFRSRAADTALAGFARDLPGTVTYTFPANTQAAWVWLTGGGGGPSFDNANGGGGAGGTAVGRITADMASSVAITIGVGGRAGIYEIDPDRQDDRGAGFGPANNGLDGGDSFIAVQAVGDDAVTYPSGTRLLTAPGGHGSSGEDDDSQGGSVFPDNPALISGRPGGDGQPNFRNIAGSSFWGGGGKAPGAGGYFTLSGKAGCVLILPFN